MSQGILLIAAGNPFYGNSAYHLALTIKAADPDAQICLAYQDSAIAHLTEEDVKFFDHMVELSPKMIEADGRPDYMKPKLHAYELSPFDRTILIDVDMIWNPKRPVSELFEELEDVPEFTMINEGWCDVLGDGQLNPRYTFWADREAIVQQFMNTPRFLQGKLYQFRSEFIYFEKCENCRLFFEKALEVREQIKFEVTTLGNNIPDELCFDISGAITHMYPHQDKWSPIHWYWFHGKPYQGSKNEILNRYYAISLGGFKAPKEVLEWTLAMLRKAAEKHGVKLRHKFGTKTSMIPERKTL